MVRRSPSTEVCAKPVEALKLDLAGSWPEHVIANELLPGSPARWDRCRSSLTGVGPHFWYFPATNRGPEGKSKVQGLESRV